MKKLFWMLLPLLLLAGCAARETMETLGDIPVEGRLHRRGRSA